MTNKELKLAGDLLYEAKELFSNNSYNDVDKFMFKYWTLTERQQLVKDYHDWNGDPEEYDPEFIDLPDYAIMGYLSYKLNIMNKIENELQLGRTIKLIDSGESFIIDRIFDDGLVDMTATKKYAPEIGMNWY